MGITSSTSEVPAWKCDAFLAIDGQFEKLAQRRRRSKKKPSEGD